MGTLLQKTKLNSLSCGAIKFINKLILNTLVLYTVTKFKAQKVTSFLRFTLLIYEMEGTVMHDL